MATPHIEAKKNDIAKTVLMPGDPLRAKFIADTYLDNVKQFNRIRNMFGYTGTYKGKRISVMGSGMGMPSIGIYSYELFKFYDVEQIVRIGSAGAYAPELDLYDTIIVDDAWSESSYAKTQNDSESPVMKASPDLTERLADIAGRLDIPVTRGRIHSSDVFYREGESVHEDYHKRHKCLAVEMESFALFHNAKVLGKKAACLLTISDSFTKDEQTTPEERQTAFTNMMKIALELAE